MIAPMIMPAVSAASTKPHAWRPMVASAMTGVGFVAGGVLVALTEPPTAFLVAGSGLLALVAGMLVAVRPRRRPAAP